MLDNFLDVLSSLPQGQNVQLEKRQYIFEDWKVFVRVARIKFFLISNEYYCLLWFANLCLNESKPSFGQT